LLADHPALVAQVGELRWREWGYDTEDAGGWIAVTAREAGRVELPITLVAIDCRGDAVGAVALGEFDGELSESERRGRSPWLLGLVVRRQSRLQGIGRLLVSELERVAASRGMADVWVATGWEAVDFYRRCGWVEAETLRLASTGVPTTILTKHVLDADNS
jgi:GNAT superfamily N-acetyltransferase